MLKRLLKNIVLALACIALLVMTTLFIAYLAIDGSFYKKVAQDAIEKTLGLSLTLDGDFSLALSLRPTVTASNATLLNPDWPGDKVVARAKHFELGLQLLPLLKGTLQLATTIEQPEIWLRIDESGRTNWAQVKKATVNRRDSVIALKIEEASINNAVFHYLDHARQRDLSMRMKRIMVDNLNENLVADLNLSGVIDNRQMILQGDLRRKPDSNALALDLEVGLSENAATDNLQLPNTPIRAQLRGELSFSDGLAFNSVAELNIRDLRTALGNKTKLPGTILSLGPITASGNIIYKDNNIHVAEIKTQLNTASIDLTASGEINRLHPSVELALDIDANSTGLAAFVEQKDAPYWASVGPIAAKARLHVNGSKYWLDKIDATVKHKDATVHLTGGVPALYPTPKYELTIQGEANDLSQFHDKLPPVGPVTAQAKVAGSKLKFEIPALTATVGKSDISGKMNMSLAGKPEFSAQLKSNRLVLSKFFAASADEPSAKPDDTTSEPNNQDKTRSIFSKEALNLNWLNRFNGDVDLSINKLETADELQERLHYTGRLKDGELLLTNTFGVPETGVEKSMLTIDARDAELKLHFRKDIDGVSMTEFLGIKPGAVDGGATHGFMEITAHGNSASAIMQDLNGEILVQVDKARVIEKGLSAVASDLGTAFVRSVTPKDDQDATTNFNCGVVGVTIEDGIVRADNTIAIESSRFNIGGGGTINLRKETVDIDIRPRAKSGLGISLATITGGFKISGKLSAPSAGLSLKGLFESYLKSSTAVLLLAQGAAAVTTTAVVVVRGLWDRVTSSRFSCENTLKRFERQRLQVAAKKTKPRGGSTFEDEYFDEI